MGLRARSPFRNCLFRYTHADLSLSRTQEKKKGHSVSMAGLMMLWPSLTAGPGQGA